MMQPLSSFPLESRIPFSESFETYANGTSISGINGWEAEAGVGMVSSNASVMATQAEWQNRTGCGFPIPEVLREQALQFDGALSNRFGPSSETSLWFDFLVAPEQRLVADLPSIGPHLMFAFHVAQNGHLMAAHSSGSAPDATNQWTELSEVELDESGWIRLSVNLVAGLDGSFYSIRVDGSAPLEHPAAFMEPCVTAPPGGIWFPCANFHTRLTSSALSISGIGWADDTTIAGARPRFETIEKSQVLISSLFDSRWGGISTSTVIETTSGTTTVISISASTYFTIVDIITNGVSFSGYDFTSTPTNHFDFSWVDIPAGQHILEIQFSPRMAARNTPYWWLAEHYPSADLDEAVLSDSDGDGFRAWAEYLAATDPNDPTSFFRIQDAGVLDGTNYVTWLGGGGDALPPFIIYRRTNLMDGAWEPVGQEPRSTSREVRQNTWFDTESPPKAFYRIIVHSD